MRFRLRTLLLVVTAACVLCGWDAYLRRMAAYHRSEAAKAFARTHPLLSQSFFPVWAAPDYNEKRELEMRHEKRARDFDHALLRPWLAFVHCDPGSTFGAPIEKPPPVKRLKSREDLTDQLDY